MQTKSSCAACAGNAGGECVSWISCSHATSTANGAGLPKPNAQFSYGSWKPKTIGSGIGSWAMKPPTMSKSRPWSNVSAPCRLEWRPSRILIAGLRVLGALAAVAVIASELPSPASVPLACAAIVYGEWLARHESRRAVSEIVIPPGEAIATINGSPMQDLHVQWRGPLAFLHWCDDEGRHRYLQGWPDNLPQAERRELRLAMAARAPAHVPRSVAP